MKSLNDRKGASPQRRLGWRSLRFEQFEQRTLLAVAGIAFHDGVVTLTGTKYEDVASAVTQPAAPYSEEQLVFRMNDHTATYDADDIQRIVVDLKGSGDSWSGQCVAKTQIIKMGDGNDTAFGGPLADQIFGGNGIDDLFGGAGNDLIDGQNHDDSIHGGSGNDILKGGNGADSLFGDCGDDTLYGGAHNDRILGGEGNDKLYGDGGNDALFGEAGRDALYGQAGRDFLKGGPDRDFLNAGQSGIQDTVAMNAPLDVNGKSWDTRVEDGYRRTYDIVIVDDTDPGPVPAVPSGWTWTQGTGVLIVDMNATWANLTVTSSNSLQATSGSNTWDFTGLTNVTIIGTPNPDTINMSSSGPGNVTSLGVTLTIYGRGSADNLTGGVGNNTLVGEGGDDVLSIPAYALPSVFDGRDGVFNNDSFVGFRSTIDTGLRDSGGSVEVVDLIDDLTGAAFYRATTVQIVEYVYPGVEGLFYDLWLDGTKVTVNPRRVNGQSITIEYDTSVTINANFRSRIGAAGSTVTSTQITGGGPFDPNRG